MGALMTRAIEGDAALAAAGMSKADQARIVQANLWLIRLRDGRAEPEALQEWLESAPENFEAFRRAEMVFGAVAAPVEKVVARRRAVTRRQVGASILALAVGGWALRDVVLNFSSITTATGETREIALEDGSHVILNTGSALQVGFTDTERAVRLRRGEAWFDVTHDTDRAFIVRASDAVVRVVGTQFNVKLADDGVQVGVSTGRVEVQCGENFAALGPGDQAHVTDDRISVVRVPADQIALWRTGWIAFDGTAFSAAMAELSRYHAGPVIVLGDNLRRRPFSARLSTRDTEAALTIAARAASARMFKGPGGLRILY
jgi:transmembrane sensor